MMLRNSKEDIEMNINERVKCLRKEELKISQEEFAKKINISRAGLASIEAGNCNVTSRIVSDISRVFGVSETWLNTGEGEMFSTADEEFEFAQLLAGSFGRDLPPIVKSIVKTTLKLDDESAACIDRFIKEVAKNLSNDEK